MHKPPGAVFLQMPDVYRIDKSAIALFSGQQSFSDGFLHIVDLGFGRGNCSISDHVFFCGCSLICLDYSSPSN